MRRREFVGLGLVGLGSSGCTREPTGREPVERPTRTRTPAPTPTPTRSPTPTRTATPTPAPEFDTTAAVRHVEELAGRIGPREATSAAYRQAADYVERQFRLAGLEVRRQRLSVPAGESWGIPVPRGRTVNLIATLPGTDATEPHLLVGAHLDTVPQAPGAEDNASGVAVLLELARLAASAPPETAVRFVAFGAEEPRGPSDDDHHYGSRHYVERLTRGQRRAVLGMVSLDRVGTGPDVRIRTAREAPTDVSATLLRAARRAGIPTSGGVNRSSDHWSFERTGTAAAARIGGHAYAGYHNAEDRPDVVRRKRLDDTGNLLWRWITSWARENGG